MTNLVPHPSGAFAFLPASTTFSNGLVVAPDHRLADWEFVEPLPLRPAFDRVAAELEQRGLTWTALAGVELRSPAPFTPAGFAEFNGEYTRLLAEYYPLPDGTLPPYTRTNVAPVVAHVAEPSVRLVHIVEPNPGAHGDFVVSGAAEVTGAPSPETTIAFGDTSPAGMRAKADFVIAELAARVAGLGVPIDTVRTIDVYTAATLEWLETVIASTFVGASRHGVHRWIAHPPVTDLAFEMGCKRVSNRVILSDRTF